MIKSVGERRGDDVAGVDMKFGPNDEWTVRMTWREGDHNGPSRLLVEPTDPDRYPAGGISQTVLREIKITDAIETLRKAREVAASDEPAPPIDWEATGRRLRELSADGLSDGYLALLSWTYSVTANQPKPIERLAELTGKSQAAVKSHLWQATRRDLLYRSPGRAGGAASVKAFRIIEASEDRESVNEDDKAPEL